MILGEEGRQVCVIVDEDVRCPSGDQSLTQRRPAGLMPLGGGSRRAAVELRRVISGIGLRALLGGTFSPGRGADVRIEVMAKNESLGFGFGRLATVDSWLGKPMVAGLPADFGPPTMSGLCESAGLLPPGVLRIDRAAYDEVESIGGAFRSAAGLLVRTLGAALAGDDPADAVRQVMETWE